VNESKFTPEALRKENTGWIGVDLDGTLAEYHGWTGGLIGSPVPAMLARVKQWLTEGKNVRIFTARADDSRAIHQIEEWLLFQGLPVLPVTNVKDKRMIELWDDRAVQVVPNTGERVDGK
jgi:hypothetical protein